ncbi:MAG: phosphoglycolate phosphatase [Gammaproteobacteria bacterium]|nr:phosphoglycolate phosphatase [Gammaproteobacteria bacterium]
MPGALLLDLDGTLVDTAPDMVACLNALLAEHAHRPVGYELARQQVSNGAVGLLTLAFGLAEDDTRMPALRARYLQLYAESVCSKSIIFNDFASVFDVISTLGWHWGVVTNKPQALARPLLAALNLRPTLDCLVGGDTLPQRKPHPAPLLHAAQILGVPAQHCVYVGDAERDVQAGRAAGMRTIAARYGYLSDPGDAQRWQADHVVDSPAELAELLGRLAPEMARAG